ncbi:peroxidase-like [Spodoptera litura]|uniref:Peroxidase-like n=1 Tax=Spodoptera litura TaxID=69820 RepID=A0A9J7ED96_SPOLT|nr:peroxidase-like [Spodoptera litura]
MDKMVTVKILLALALCYAAEGIHLSYRSSLHITGLAATLARVAAFGSQTEGRRVTGFGCSKTTPKPDTDQDSASKTCGLAPTNCTKSRYRSVDGSCNNLERPVWGLPNTPLRRIAPVNYDDGVSALKAHSKTGRPLPNTRELSLRLYPDLQVIDPVWTLNTQQWGQIVAHDLSLSANDIEAPDFNPPNKGLTNCCDDNGKLTILAQTVPFCAPIVIPRNDPVYPRETECINFVRTETTKDRGCTPPNVAAQQLTSVTTFMDLSTVYGSSQSQANAVRARRGGRLLTIVRGGREWLPNNPKPTVNCETARLPNEPCYLAGDARVNQNPQLATLQVVLLREHNRIADTLAQLNPHWNDETIFQEARRIHIAETQHINYYEYLPILLGYENMVKNKLIYPDTNGYVNDYDPGVDPSIINEYNTAAFRHFHSLIRGHLELVSENRRTIGAVRLSDWYTRPLLLELDNAFDHLVRGLTTQAQDSSDQSLDVEITQYLFRRNYTYGSDLRARDIQRGRDHGLASYIDTRAACGLSVPKNFSDMLDYISQENVAALQNHYASLEDVELMVAGSLERNAPGAQAGPTFVCIIMEQFYRTRVGDRYFYENGADPDIAFTPSQLDSIRKGASIARLLCDNSDGIQSMQPRAFQKISHTNELVPCDTLPAINLTLWQDV